MTDFDVVVVGAGASGLWAAISAAREGAKTLVIEKAQRVGERIVCAEGVEGRGLERLTEIKPEWIASAIGAARLCSPGGLRAEVPEPGAGFIIHKDVFLRDLAREATDMGVELMLGAEAVDVREAAGGSLAVHTLTGPRPAVTTCGAVVAADGVECSIGRRLGIVGALKPADLFSCAQDTVAPIDLAGGTVEVYFGRDVAPGGYAWVFPKGKDVANVGVGIAAGGRGGLSALQYLARFKRARCHGSRVLRSIVGGVPSERSPLRRCRGGVFLAGDAARVADPITGAGIVQGMRSGGESGRHACIYARGGARAARAEKDFARALKSQFEGRALRWALRQALMRMGDKDFDSMVRWIGEYRLRGISMLAEPVALMRFLASAMPAAFNITRHLARV